MIADFGLAVIASEDKSIMLQDRCGTPCYVAPEILRNEGYREKCDIFSLGSVFFNLLTGHFLFNGLDEFEQIQKNRDCDLSIIYPYITDLSFQCKDLLFKMLEPDPEMRLSAR